jgi:hypothetical protein
MRERDWLTRDDPVRMLRHLRRRMTDRKLRLFLGEAYLPIHQEWSSLDSVSRTLFANELELWASGRLTEMELQTGTLVLGVVLQHLREGKPRVFVPSGFEFPIQEQDWFDAHRLAMTVTGLESARLANLLRDIFGNPFRPLTVNSDWLTPTVQQLAAYIYESRDFSTMPILADALQDAGCDNADVLNHCRDTKATHVRGCWVVDLVLGKD